MAKVKREPPKPLVPHHERGVTVVRIPAGTSAAERQKAITWLHNLAKKYNQNYSWY